MTDGNIELCRKLRIEYGNPETTAEDTKKKEDDIFSLFLYGLRSSGTRLTRTCLEIIGDIEECNGRRMRNDWKSIVVSYTAFGKALKNAAETLSLVTTFRKASIPSFLHPGSLSAFSKTSARTGVRVPVDSFSNA